MLKSALFERPHSKRPALFHTCIFFAVLISHLTLTGCGGSDASNAISQDAPPDTLSFSTAPVVTSEHLGSLYRPFDWSGPIRDPMRNAIEIQNADHFVALSTESRAELEAISAERDIIMQIGGMGSAKLDSNATEPSDQFVDYMNGIIIDDGAQWRAVVAERAREVVATQPAGSTIYWQIGNEVNASSYTRNAKLFFENDTQGMSDRDFSIATYVEYFFAPTVQAFRQIESEQSNDILIALGSISNFAAPSQQDFLDTLLNYSIVGTNAPSLAGYRVHELIDLITIHYLAGAEAPDNPSHWYDTLQILWDKWLGGNIRGVWATEEVGIATASSGAGAGAALLVQARYWQWVSQNNLGSQASRWFYYGATAGPEGQQIDDALSTVFSLVGNNSVQHVETVHDTVNEVDTYAFYAPVQEAFLVSATSLSSSPVDIHEVVVNNNAIPANLPLNNTTAWLYGNDGTTIVNTTTNVSEGMITLNLDAPVALSKPETLLFWVQSR